MRLRVWSLASLSGLRNRHCPELWCRSRLQLGSGVAVAVAVVALIWPLAWELSYAMGMVLKRPKKKKKKNLNASREASLGRKSARSGREHPRPQSWPPLLKERAVPAFLTSHLGNVLPMLSLLLWQTPALCVRTGVFGCLFLWAKWKNKEIYGGGEYYPGCFGRLPVECPAFLRVTLTSLRKIPRWSLSASLLWVDINQKTTCFVWVSTLPRFTWVLGAGELLGTATAGRLGRGEKVRSGAIFTLPRPPVWPREWMRASR